MSVNRARIFSLLLFIPIAIMSHESEKFGAPPTSARLGLGGLSKLYGVWSTVCDRRCSQPGRFVGNPRIFCAMCPSSTTVRSTTMESTTMKLSTSSSTSSPPPKYESTTPQSGTNNKEQEKLDKVLEQSRNQSRELLKEFKNNSDSILGGFKDEAAKVLERLNTTGFQSNPQPIPQPNPNPSYNNSNLGNMAPNKTNP